jgi:four helix bundle protein
MEQGTRNEARTAEDRGFRGLVAWQKADELASAVYQSLRALRSSERWLASQAIRAAISVPANIAEGYGRGSVGDYTRFLDIARGSLSELEYYVLFLRREGLLTEDQAEAIDALRRDAGRLLFGLWKSLRAKSRNGTWDRSGRIADERTQYLADSEDVEEADE